MMMKGDVLSGFETLKVCAEYKYKGKTISHFPYNIEPENVTPFYKDFKGCQADLTDMTTYDELRSLFSKTIMLLLSSLFFNLKL